MPSECLWGQTQVGGRTLEQPNMSDGCRGARPPPHTDGAVAHQYGARQRNGLWVLGLAIGGLDMVAGTTYSGDSSRPPSRVLLVVDQPVLKGVLTLVLNHGVFVSRTATTIAEVATVIREWQPQLAIVDMDIASGQLVGALANVTSSTERIPVIALTRRGDLQTKLDAINSDADDILTIPFSPEELVARALRIMRRVYGAVPAFEPVIAVGGLEIDMLNRRIREGPAEYHLTPIEIGLLYLLAAHAGQLLSRTEIVDTIWGSDYVGDSSVVDRHIRSLRNKLENEDLHEYIKTVPGRGYSFTPRAAVMPA